jgi:PAS domain S-box-containing protein
MKFDYSTVIFENSRDAILVHSPDTTILDANRAACELMGCAREELIGRRIADIEGTFRPLDGKQVDDRRTRGYIVFERVIVRKDGTRIPVEVSNSFMIADGQEVIIAILRDLRDWYGAKKDLMDSEERFRTFVEQSMDAILLVDNQGLVREWNRAMESISGIKKADVLGSPVWDVMDRLGIAQGAYPGVNAQNNRERVEQALRTGESYFFNRVQEYEFLNLKGERRSVRQVIFPIKRRNELWAGCIIQDNNVVKRKQAELENSEAHLRAILDNVQTGIIMVDPVNHSIVDANPAAVAMFGAPKEAIMGSVCHNFICPADVGKCPVTDLHQTIECSERTLIRNDRSRVPVIKTVTTFLLDGQPLLLESFVDITERKRMEEKIRQSEEQLRLLTSNLKDVIYLIDVVPELTFKYISPAIFSLLGYSVKEFGEMDQPMALMHPDDLAEFQDLIFGAKKRWSADPSFRMRMRRKDGEYVWMDTRNTCIADENGKLVRIEGSARDISAEVRAREELERTARTDKTISSLSTRIANLKTSEIDAGIKEALCQIGKYVNADRGFIYTRADEKGTMEISYSWTSLGAGKGPTLSLNFESSNVPLLRNLLKGGDVLYIPDTRAMDLPDPESYRALRDKGILSAVVVPSILGGELRGYIGFDTIGRTAGWDQEDIRLLSITGEMLTSVLNRKRTEERLSAESERLAVTLRSIGDAVITIDEQGSIILGNKVAEEMTGLNRYTMVGMNIREVIALPEVDWDRIATAESGGPIRSEVSGPNGVKQVIEYHFTTLLGGQDEKMGKVFVFRDVSEKDRAEIAEANAERLESIGTLAGGIAHDFNNLMTSVTGELYLLRSEIDQSESSTRRSRERLDEMEMAMDRAKFVAQGLLSLSKGGAPILKPTKLKRLLEDTARLAFTGSRLNWTLECPDDLWTVNVDINQMNRAFMNILLNAQEASTSAGTINITARNSSGAWRGRPAGKFVVIEFLDHGSGIPEDVLPRIFDPYYTTKSSGTGLGMTVTYSTVTRHGGDIQISSVVGKGTKVTIRIPATEENAASEPEALKVERGSGRILVMDDERIILEITSEVLTELGYSVEVAVDGKEALEKYRESMSAGRKFDAVIMDLTIPGGMGGKEAIQRLLNMDPGAKAIVSSGYSNDPVMANFLDYGFAGVVPKPYKISELSKSLKNVLGH